MDAAPRRLAGIDFTSAPSRRKPIVVALGRFDGGSVRLERIELHADFAGFEAWLHEPQPWVGAFDFPFGLPRAFVDANRLGTTCEAVIHEVRRRCPTRMQWRALIDAWGNTQPAGHRLLHRRTDVAWPGFSSTSPLQTRYVPVGFMYYEGLARLVDADVDLPGLQSPREGGPARVALEGYPGLFAHRLIGRRSYKNHDAPDRRAARADLLAALEAGAPALGVRLRLPAALREEAIDDASGDRLDALLCLMQAAWAAPLPAHGMPDDVDPVEGWIVGMPFDRRAPA
jgi:hypothetical protein